ncbi:MAG: 16S rRNA (cytidine(1402)-2'-O)-methyltransferase [Flavobacteriales bacterium]|jgi:16S rRNA (cytidine1402-2'-O)-methyltransferase
MKLVVVPTPIGNLGDLTPRAAEVLRTADTIYCEDTRESRKLLQHIGSDRPLIAYHQHNEHQRLDTILSHIRSSQSCALVSDAGMPGISDPGFLLVRACLNAGIQVECLPGPSAILPALVLSGLPCERFAFEGFLPHKKGRETRIKAIASERRTTVMYESPHRLLKTLSQLEVHCGQERACSVSRELSKKFEETIRGTLRELIAHFTSHEPRGEFVIVLAGHRDE